MFLNTQVVNMGAMLLGRRPFEFPQRGGSKRGRSVSGRSNGRSIERPWLTRVPKQFVLEEAWFSLAPCFKLRELDKVVGRVREVTSVKSLLTSSRSLRQLCRVSRWEWANGEGELQATARRSVFNWGAKTTIRDRTGTLLATVEERLGSSIIGSFIQFVVWDEAGVKLASSRKLLLTSGSIELLDRDSLVVRLKRDRRGKRDRWVVTVEDPDGLHPAVAVFMGALKTGAEEREQAVS